MSHFKHVIQVIKLAQKQCDGDNALALARLTAAVTTLAVLEGFPLSDVSRIVANTYRDALTKLPAHAHGEGARDDVN